MKKIKLLPGHYYIKLKGPRGIVLAFYDGTSVAPWSAVDVWVGWSKVESVLG